MQKIVNEVGAQTDGTLASYVECMGDVRDVIGQRRLLISEKTAERVDADDAASVCYLA